MFKLLPTVLILLLLSACSSQEKSEQKESNTTTSTTKQVTVADEATQMVKQEPTALHPDTNTSSSSGISLTLKTITGEELHIDEVAGGLSFKEYKNKVVLVIFFGHKCPPCLAEIPVLKDLVNQGHQDLEIVAIEVQGQNEEELKAFQKRMDINYHLVTGKDHYTFINYIAQKANWTGSIPFLIGFDKNSEVKVVHVGGVNAEQFNDIYTTLAENNQ